MQSCLLFLVVAIATIASIHESVSATSPIYQCPPTTRQYCPNGRVKDNRGCDTNDCYVCPPTTRQYCLNGRVKDSRGCDTNDCFVCPPTTRQFCWNGRVKDNRGCKTNDCYVCPPTTRQYCPNGRVKDSRGCDTNDCYVCPPTTRQYCPNGRVKDNHGCDTNYCFVCPPTTRQYCPNGRVKDSRGCDTNDCQWVVSPKGLPEDGKHPENWSLTLKLDNDNQITLDLTLNKNIPRRVPLYENVNGTAKQVDLLNSKHTAYYYDVMNQAAISLTNFDGLMTLYGSFLMSGTKYNIEPQTRVRVKRSILGAGDKLKQLDEVLHNIKPDYVQHRQSKDFKMPDPDSSAARRNAEAAKIRKRWQEEGSHEWAERKRTKRQNLPSTTYVVQIYMIIDFSLYTRMQGEASLISWPGTADDYINYMAGHMGNEIDIIFRSINSDSFTIATKLSYLQVDKTVGASTYTEPLKKSGDILNADRGLDKLTAWDATADLPADTDHVMLFTAYDLYSVEAGLTDTTLVGLAYLSGICESPYRQSINEFFSSNAAAHELGHNLGSEHDGIGNKCNGADLFVMSGKSSSRDNTRENPWLFSTCSVDYFESEINALNNANVKCLRNSGSYIPSWADDFSQLLGQTITPDQQCKIASNASYVFAGGLADAQGICTSLWCRDSSGTNGFIEKRAAFEYTTCDDGKWCVKGECVSDANAPAADASCPLGELTGPVYDDFPTTCSMMTNGSWCYDSGIPEKCCESCPKFLTGMTGCEYGDKKSFCTTLTVLKCYEDDASCCGTCAALEKPWLGPNCKYGDKEDWCSGLPLTAGNCKLHGESCCESCCELNGPADGYACV